MFEVSVRQHFEAAHYLRGYGGKCESLHGHRYEVAVTVTARELNEIGLAVDFTELKSKLEDVLSEFDHKCLNDLPEFAIANPSAENIASNVHKKLQSVAPGFEIRSVTVWESPDAWVTYFPQ